MTTKERMALIAILKSGKQCGILFPNIQKQRRYKLEILENGWIGIAGKMIWV